MSDDVATYQPISISQFIEDRKIELKVRDNENPTKRMRDMMPEHSKFYSVTLIIKDDEGRRTLKMPFACAPLAGFPTAYNVLCNLVSDASAADMHDYMEFAREFGYPTDEVAEQRAVERIYNACVKVAVQLEEWLPSDVSWRDLVDEG